MPHIKVEILATDDEQEQLIALLDDCDASGFEQTDAALIAYFPKDNFRREEVIKIVEGYPNTISEVAEQNWNAIWEQNFQPVVVNNFCAVRAHFHPPAGNVEHEIIITPKMSFGTGHHATTYMMIEQMQTMPFKEKTVFDFGTGTGILSILAHKLGAASVTAIDVDEWSIENAKENFEKNQCVSIDLHLSTSIPSKQFDYILANINRNVILQCLPFLKQSLETGSQLLVSGILLNDENDIVMACKNAGLLLNKRMDKSGWVSLLFINAI